MSTSSAQSSSQSSSQSITVNLGALTKALAVAIHEATANSNSVDQPGVSPGSMMSVTSSTSRYDFLCYLYM